MNAPQKNIRGDPARFQHFQKKRRLCFQNWKIADEVKGVVLHGSLVARQRRSRFGSGHFVHRHLPSALSNFRISGGEVRSRNLQIEHRLARRFVSGMKKSQGLAFVFRPQADLFAVGGVFAVISVAALKQNESCFHNSF